MLEFKFLHQEFNFRAMIHLEEIVEKGYLTMCLRTAKNRASLDALPFPVIRTEDSQKSAFMILFTDLYEWLNERYKMAKDSWEKMNR